MQCTFSVCLCECAALHRSAPAFICSRLTDGAIFVYGVINPCDRQRWQHEGAQLSSEETTPLNAGHLWFFMLLSSLRLWRAAAIFAVGPQHKLSNSVLAASSILLYVATARPEATEPAIGWGDPFKEMCALSL